MLNPIAKPGAKQKGGSPKDGGKGKEGGLKDQPKVNPSSKSKAPGGTPKPKPKPKAEAGKPTVNCLFYPNCNRGDSCPFLHEGAPKAKAESKASPAKASAKVTVATLLTSSIRGAEASRTNVTSMGKAWKMFIYSFKAFFASITSVSSLFLAESVSNPNQVCCLQLFAAPTFVRSAEQACVATWSQSGSYDIEWICDSGVFRSLISVQSLVDQGTPENLVYSCLLPVLTIKFETKYFNFHGSNFGVYEYRILDSCPIARSLGEIVSSGRPFVWMPGEMPYIAESGESLRIKCRGNKLVADRIEENVPIFNESM